MNEGEEAKRRNISILRRCGRSNQIKGLWGKPVILYTKSLIREVKAFLPVSARRGDYYLFYLETKASWTVKIEIANIDGGRPVTSAIVEQECRGFFEKFSSKEIWKKSGR